MSRTGALTNLTIKPIFAGDVITPQTVRSYQPVFSAAFIAHIELAYPEEAKHSMAKLQQYLAQEQANVS